MKLFTILSTLLAIVTPNVTADTPPPTPSTTNQQLVEPIKLSGHYQYTSCRYQFNCNEEGNKCNLTKICHPHECLSFHVASGTGCAWMCNYCQKNLGTTDYYFTDNVCKYESGGCKGNPLVGKEYTCCTV